MMDTMNEEKSPETNERRIVQKRVEVLWYQDGRVETFLYGVSGMKNADIAQAAMLARMTLLRARREHQRTGEEGYEHLW